MNGYDYQYHIPDPGQISSRAHTALTHMRTSYQYQTRTLEGMEFWKVWIVWQWQSELGTEPITNLTTLISIRSKPLPKVRSTRLRGLRAPEAGSMSPRTSASTCWQVICVARPIALVGVTSYRHFSSSYATTSSSQNPTASKCAKQASL